MGAARSARPSGRARATIFAARDRKLVAALEDKLVRKNEVLSELMEEHVALTKSLGES